MTVPPPGRRPGGRFREALTRLGLAVASVAMLLGVVELTLRATGFRYVLYPEDLEFGRPDPVMLKRAFVPDDVLFWVTPSYHRRLAALADAPPEIVFMGDSCTQFGRYDEALAELVARRGGHLDYANLGVAGWSSHQGRRQMERDVAPLAPEVVTVYYGWNDHWIGFGIEDRDVERLRRVFSSRWSRLRVVQLVMQATVAVVARSDAKPERVSLDDFRANLRAIVATARRHGTSPMLLTAPSSHRPGEEPAELTERWLRQLSDLVPLHRAYVEAVRQVAAEEGTALCDLAAAFAALPPATVAASFMADGIHLTPTGNRHLARFLAGCLEEAGLWQRLADPQAAPSAAGAPGQPPT